MRLLEWVLATIGAASTIAVTLLSVPAATGDTGASAILGAVALAGFLGFVATALDDKRAGRRWGAIVSLVAGMLGSLVVLAGFSFGLFLVPAAVAFLAVVVLAARRQGRSVVRQAGIYVGGALGTALVILLLNLFDWV